MKRFLNNIFAIVLCVGMSSMGCSYSSKSNKVLKNNEIAVPEGKDSFCKSVILSSLLPVIDDDYKFIERQKNLFGKNMEIDRVEFAKNVKDIEYLRGDEFYNLVEAFCDNIKLDLEDDDIDKKLKNNICFNLNIEIQEFYLNEKYKENKSKKYSPASQNDDEDSDDDDDNITKKLNFSINIVRDYPDVKEKNQNSIKNPPKKNHYRSPIPDIYNQFLENLNNKQINNQTNSDSEEDSYDQKEEIELSYYSTSEEEKIDPQYNNQPILKNGNNSDREEKIDQKLQDFEEDDDSINGKHTNIMYQDDLNTKVDFSDNSQDNNSKIEPIDQNLKKLYLKYKELFTQKYKDISNDIDNFEEKEQLLNPEDQKFIPYLGDYNSSSQKDIAYYYHILKDLPKSYMKDFKEIYLSVFLNYITKEEKIEIHDKLKKFKFDSDDVKKRILNLPNTLKSHPKEYRLTQLLNTITSQAKNENWKEVYNILVGIKAIIEPLDVELLKLYVHQAISASKDIEKENIVMFIGKTGAGKSTTIHYLAGSKMKKVKDKNNLDHIQCVDQTVDNKCKNITTSAERRSETRYVSTVQINLQKRGINITNNNTINLCDCPGIEDTNGPEVDISNALGIISMLNKVNSVKPVVLIPYNELEGRSQEFTKFGKSLVDFIPNFNTHKDNIIFLISKVKEKKLNDIHNILLNIQKHIGGADKSNDQYTSFIDYMVYKSNIKDSQVRIIDPLNKGQRDTLLEYICRSEFIEYPISNFYPCISLDSKAKIKDQIKIFGHHIQEALEQNKNDIATYYLKLWKYLIDLLPEQGDIKQSYNRKLKDIETRQNERLVYLEKRINSLSNNKNRLENDLIEIKDNLTKIENSSLNKTNHHKFRNRIFNQLIDIVANSFASIVSNNIYEESIWDHEDKILVISKSFDKLSFLNKELENIFDKKLKDLDESYNKLILSDKYKELIKKILIINESKKSKYKDKGFIDICNKYLKKTVSKSSEWENKIQKIIMFQVINDLDNLNDIISKNIEPLADNDINDLKTSLKYLTNFYKEINYYIEYLPNLEKIKDNYHSALKIINVYVQECCKQITSSNKSNISITKKKRYLKIIKELRRIPEINYGTQLSYSSLERRLNNSQEGMEDELIDLINKTTLDNPNFKNSYIDKLDKIHKIGSFYESQYNIELWRNVFKYIKIRLQYLEDSIEENDISLRSYSNIDLYYKIIRHAKDLFSINEYLPNHTDNNQLNQEFQKIFSDFFSKAADKFNKIYKFIIEKCDVSEDKNIKNTKKLEQLNIIDNLLKEIKIIDKQLLNSKKSNLIFDTFDEITNIIKSSQTNIELHQSEKKEIEMSIDHLKKLLKYYREETKLQDLQYTHNKKIKKKKAKSEFLQKNNYNSIQQLENYINKNDKQIEKTKKKIIKHKCIQKIDKEFLNNFEDPEEDDPDEEDINEFLKKCTPYIKELQNKISSEKSNVSQYNILYKKFKTKYQKIEDKLKKAKTSLTKNLKVNTEEVDKIINNKKYRSELIRKSQNQIKEQKNPFRNFNIKSFYKMKDLVSKSEKAINKIPKSKNKTQLIATKNEAKEIINNYGIKYGKYINHEIDNSFQYIKERFNNNKNQEIMNIDDTIKLDQQVQNFKDNFRILQKYQKFDSNNYQNQISEEKTEYFQYDIIEEKLNDLTSLIRDLSTELKRLINRTSKLQTLKTQIDFAHCLCPLDDIMINITKVSFFSLFDEYQTSLINKEDTNILNIKNGLIEMDYYQIKKTMSNIKEMSEIENGSQSIYQESKNLLYDSLKRKMKALDQQIILLDKAKVEDEVVISINNALTKLYVAKDLFFDNKKNSKTLSTERQKDLQKCETDIRNSLNNWINEIFKSVDTCIDSLEFYEAEEKLKNIERFSKILKDNNEKINKDDLNPKLGINNKLKKAREKIDKKLNNQIEEYEKIKLDTNPTGNPYSSLRPKELFQKLEKATENGGVKYKNTAEKIRQSICKNITNIINKLPYLTSDKEAKNLELIYKHISSSLTKDMKGTLDIEYHHSKKIFEEKLNQWKFDVENILNSGGIEQKLDLYEKVQKRGDYTSINKIRKSLETEKEKIRESIEKDINNLELAKAQQKLNNIKKYKKTNTKNTFEGFKNIYDECSKLIDIEIEKLKKRINNYSESIETYIGIEKNKEFQRDLKILRELYTQNVR